MFLLKTSLATLLFQSRTHTVQLLQFAQNIIPLQPDTVTMPNKHPEYAPAICLAATVMLLVLASCREHATPRPDGYFRIDPYPAAYTPHTIGNIYIDVNDSARCIATHTQANAQWLDIVYPRYNATLYISYIPIDNNLDRLMHESIDLVYRQNVNTGQVEAVAYENAERRLYATLYALSSESATPLQFIATDSTRYLLRGALYFDTPGRSDSIAPSLQYIETDIMQLIESITPINP